MATWLEKLRKVDQRNKEQEKLAREMTHRPQADIESLRGQDPLTDWGLGVRERTLNPLATLAVEAKRFQGLSPQEMGMELAGGGIAGTLRKAAGKAAQKTEFELAHELAQRNAVLPVEQGGLGLPANNTAMDRAKAMGFDTPAYHVSDADIQAFDLTKSGSNTATNTDSEWASRLANAGVWSANEDVTLNARRALGKTGGMFGDIVYPLLIETPKTSARSLDTLERKLKKGKLKNTTKVNDEEFGVVSYVSPDEKKIRSRFAAFDPFQRNSANILAGVGAGAVGLSSLAGYPKEGYY